MTHAKFEVIAKLIWCTRDCSALYCSSTLHYMALQYIILHFAYLTPYITLHYLTLLYYLVQQHAAQPRDERRAPLRIGRVHGRAAADQNRARRRVAAPARAVRL